MLTANTYRGVTYSSRQIAAAQGERMYAGTRVCRNGHAGALRYVSTGQCAECVRQANQDRAALLKASRQPSAIRATLFTYRLHPDDHAAALAFCQALDMQRGRMPQATEAVGGMLPQPVPASPADVARHRARIMQELGAGPRQEHSSHLSEEMRAQLAAVGVLRPTNGLV